MMMYKFFSFILLAFVVLAAFAVIAPTEVSAQAEVVCEGLSGAGVDGCVSDGGPSVNGTIGAVINILSFVAGIIAVVMIIISGARFITSGGDAQQVSAARTALIYAVVGIVVVATSQIIVQFVLQETTQTPAPQDTKL